MAFQAADGTWAPSSKECWNKLPNHTEGHQLNGRDALSRKAGLRLGKNSAGVEVKNLLGQAVLSGAK